jgi:hypothetical protein
MRNTLEDLNNHLFMQLERLGEEDLTSEKLQEEIERAKSITDVATQIIATGSLALKAETFIQEYGLAGKTKKKMPPMLRAGFME